MKCNLQKFRSSLGFSLPEVTIAVAIAALGIVSVLGLIPSGLESVRAAGAMTTASRIVQQIVSEVQRAEWGDSVGSSIGWQGLLPYQNMTKRFDDQGVEILSTDATGMQLTYLARIYLYGEGDRPARLPGDTAAASVATGLRKNVCLMRVDIAETSNPNFQFPDPSAGVVAGTPQDRKLITRILPIARLR